MHDIPKYDLEVEIDTEERFEFAQDFSSLMDESEDESILTVAVTITKLSDGTNKTSTMLIDNSERVADKFGMIAYGVTGAGGEDEEDYAAKILATTSREVGATSPRLKALHLIKVRNR